MTLEEYFFVKKIKGRLLQSLIQLVLPVLFLVYREIVTQLSHSKIWHFRRTNYFYLLALGQHGRKNIYYSR